MAAIHSWTFCIEPPQASHKASWLFLSIFGHNQAMAQWAFSRSPWQATLKRFPPWLRNNTRHHLQVLKEGFLSLIGEGQVFHVTATPATSWPPKLSPLFLAAKALNLSPKPTLSSVLERPCLTLIRFLFGPGSMLRFNWGRALGQKAQVHALWSSGMSVDASTAGK